MWNSSSSRESIRNLSARESLFGMWLGLLAVSLVLRSRILILAHQQLSLPLTAYQDLFFLTIVSWAFWIVLDITDDTSAGTLVYSMGLTAYAFVAFYSLINMWILKDLGSTLTYRILFSSNQTVGAAGAIRDKLTASHILQLAAAPTLILVIGYGTLAFAPDLVQRGARWFHSARGLVSVGAFLSLGALLAPIFLPYQPLLVNPELGFLMSCFKAQEPKLPQSFPALYQKDFWPIGRRYAETEGRGALHPKQHSTLHRPLNVVLLVMESVGANEFERSIELAPSRVPSALAGLAQHALSFPRFYTSQPTSSSAMAGMLESLYPAHSWRSITYTAPAINIPSLASVLRAHGYRTAFLGQSLDYDGEYEFLVRHGFSEIINRNDEPDDVVFALSQRWIEANHSTPFFLMLWTCDTHNPYRASGRSQLSRYRAAVATSEANIGKLLDALDHSGLGQNTLIVITGDHGEAFGQHFNWGHGLTVYDEEVRVPLMLANPMLFPKRSTNDEAGQMIDIAPTVLDLLGFDPPPQWQGRSLFDAARSGRVYLFASEGFFTLGFLNSGLKYVYDAETRRTALYDLGKDPDERINLIENPRYADRVREGRQRLAAWLAFQNSYLSRPYSADQGLETEGSSGATLPHRSR